MVVSAWPVAWQRPTWRESPQQEPTEQIQTAAVGRRDGVKIGIRLILYSFPRSSSLLYSTHPPNKAHLSIGDTWFCPIHHLKKDASE